MELRELLERYKTAKVLTTKGRKQIKAKNFALPRKASETAPKGQKGSYPIPDISHARNALSRGAQYLSGEELAKLREKVYAKYPSLKKQAGLDGELGAHLYASY